MYKTQDFMEDVRFNLSNLKLPVRLVLSMFGPTSTTQVQLKVMKNIIVPGQSPNLSTFGLVKHVHIISKQPKW